MGLEVSELTSEEAKRIGIPADTKGVLIKKVQPGGLADQMGIQANDVISEVQQQKVETVEEFNKLLGELSLAEGISVKVVSKSGTKFLYFRSRG
jgi:S1-C subfamily serine protease